MKSTKLLGAIIICLALGLCASVLFNLGIIKLPKSLEKAITPNEPPKVFHLTNMKMTLNYDWSSNLPKDVAVIKLDFTIKNISKEPQPLYQENLSLFDYNDCRYDVSTTFNSKLNPLLFSETINPNTSKELSVIFEVQKNELYSVGYSDNIERIGKQIFVDKIRNITCEYVTFKEMKAVRNRLLSQPPKQTVSSITEEVIIPEPMIEEPTNSAYESLTKKGTNPANEIEVDLNDFLGMPDDGIDWNSTELSESDCKALARQKIYYSENKATWVKEKLSNNDSAMEAQQRREAVEREMAGQASNISFELQGRQAKQIPTIANKTSITGFLFIKIEVSPNGDVISCEIDKRSTIENLEVRELCISSAKNMKFNAINSNINQYGTIRYNFTK